MDKRRVSFSCSLPEDTSRLLGMSDSAGALVFSEDSPRSGSPTRQKRFQRPPMPLTPGDSPRQTPRTARSRSYYRHPTKSSEFNRRSQKNLDSCGDDDDDAYRMRNFSLTPKGVVNRGDSFRRRRSRSSSLVPGTRLAFTDDEPLTVENIPNSASDDEAAKENRSSYVVAMLGALGVGKGALLNQFMTSEHVNPYEGTEGGGDENEKNIFVTMDGEETELTFRTIRSVKTDIDRTNPPKAIIVVYSVVDKSSFNRAHDELKHLENMELTTFRTVIVVGNKIDLARSRAVSTQDGRHLATTYHAKFIEVSVGINHNCDELLAGLLTQIKLREEAGLDQQTTIPGNKSGFGKSVSKVTSKARQMFTWFFGKDTECELACEDLLRL
ncbi:GTP-binding protein REM 1-like isoform X2 [Artemia franciscana]|uniref:GTP-binding protein REM 1-like isoform X2 n=1 Tax=Artemia franciscana TaxID=6661 RepID=UPI0032DABFAB